MSQRTKTIRISEDEKKSLDEAAKVAFGTTDVPFGAVVSMLTTEYLTE